MAAVRPVYQIVTDPNDPNFYHAVDIEFRWFPGLSTIQRRRSIVSLQRAYMEEYPESNVIEVTTKSLNHIGEQFSPFYLTVKLPDGQWKPVETVYHACKVYEKGGPFLDILEKEPGHARKDERRYKNGELIGFQFGNKTFPADPPTYFFTWLYITALTEHPDQAKILLDYDAFTDILFNPKKGKVNQAMACAIYVSLVKRGLLEDAMSSPESYRKIVFPNSLLIEK